MSDANSGPSVTDQEILTVFANTDDRWLRTDEVAGELPIRAEDLDDRIEDLYERGLLERDVDEVAGERWGLAPDAGEGIPIPESEVETDTEAQAAKTTGSGTPPHEEETPETPPPDPQDERIAPVDEPVAEAIDTFDLPGSPDDEDLARGALRQAYTYLRQRGSARRDEFVSDVFPRAPAGYEGPEEGWWAEVVRPGLDRLPYVELVDEDADEWRYTSGGHADGPEE